MTDYVHTWLSRSREEAYSDWLAWIVNQLAEVRELFTLFAVEDPSAETALQGRIPGPAREVVVDWGAPDHTGRIDIEIHQHRAFLLVLELKLCAPEEADLSKLPGYARYSVRRGVNRKHVHRRLVALGGCDNEYNGFRLVTWDPVAISLRKFALQWLNAGRFNPDNVARAAQVLALSGAIEENLLGFSTDAARKAAQDRPVSLPSTVVKHLESVLGGTYHAAS